VIPGASVKIERIETGAIYQLTTDHKGRYRFQATWPGSYQLTVSLEGFKSVEMTVEPKPGGRVQHDFVLEVGTITETVTVTAGATTLSTSNATVSSNGRSRRRRLDPSFRSGSGWGPGTFRPGRNYNTEQYDHIKKVGFVQASHTPLSTFSIDVDTASYSNVRRFLRGGRLPPADAVRIEELINYFDYEYDDPAGNEPFSITTEISECPWNPGHRLAHVALRSKSIATENLPPNNLVFLLDVSGSMSSGDKLPLLKKAFALLVDQLRPEDRVAIVVYAGAAGTVLKPTEGSKKTKIIRALSDLEAGGSTAGGAGIQLAYKLARDSFMKDGNNRVILATDGDFNVGVSNDGELVKIIEREREHNIFLTVLGFGTGNLKDSKMEKLADHGNGNYAYIDSLLEAGKVLVQQMGATLLTVAKDMKLQVEFNPVKVKAYRLLGYENRRLRDEEFNDDKKDAGDLGAGHSVTALYEIIPADSDEAVSDIDPLKYQKTVVRPGADVSHEVLTVKLRYKQPDADKSRLLVRVLNEPAAAEESSRQMDFASAVAEFGLLLRHSEFKGEANFDRLSKRAKSALGADDYGRRAEFLFLVKTAKNLVREEERSKSARR
jgi:Ca-activated chloride channel family protein